MRRLVTVVLLLCLAVSCAVPEDDPQAPTRSFAGGGCPASQCTGNSAMLEPYRLTEVNELGIPNGDGVSVDGFWKHGVRYRPDVVGARLTATRAATRALTGADLEHGYFRLLTPMGVFHLYVMHVGAGVQYWRGANTTVETYELNYTGPGVPIPVPLCKTPPPNASGDGNLWVMPLHAILFAGDRYDTHYKLIASTDAASGDWFNIACPGGPFAKLHLNRFTTAGATATQATTAAERQDLLSMYTGNFCGTGRPFTRPNAPIRWGSANDWRSLTDFSGYEAVWSNGRAICLDTARLEGVDPGIRAKIDAECVDAGVGVLPACSSLSWFPASWRAFGNVISGNPP